MRTVRVSLKLDELQKGSTDLTRRLENLAGSLEGKITYTEKNRDQTRASQQRLEALLRAHDTRAKASPYGSGFEDKETLQHLITEKERLETLLASPERTTEEELMDAEVSDAVVVGESKELERAA